MQLCGGMERQELRPKSVYTLITFSNVYLISLSDFLCRFIVLNFIKFNYLGLAEQHKAVSSRIFVPRAWIIIICINWIKKARINKNIDGGVPGYCNLPLNFIQQ